ncbi:N-acetyltransferase family protein [Carnobacterium jeotgali]|uniref:GNAT family N-acetyltransferase n=1 Tax=Carnobacterium jeotgali TaxID=545534 RepID=UPI003C741B51
MIEVTFTTQKALIREASLNDLPEMVDIYNKAILTGGITCDIDVFTVEQRKSWFESHQTEKYPLFIYEVDGKVAGYSHLSGYRVGRRAVERVAEISYYVNSDYRNRGIGSKLVEHTLQQAREIGYHNIMAMIVEGNGASEYLLSKFGFQQWGRMPKVAEFNGELHDHLYYGMKLN